MLLLFGSGIIAKKIKTYYITFICDIIYIKPKPETQTLKLKNKNKLLIIKTKKMKEVYLYFRTQATLAADDDSAQSCMFPLSAFKGMHPTADDTLAIHFTPQIRNNGDGQADDFTNNDKVVMTVGTNDHKDAMIALARLFSGAANGGIHHEGVIVVADDLTATYAVSEVTALSTISIGAAFA